MIYLGESIQSKTVIVTESQLRDILSESEWNYHFGKGHNMEPYYSDNKYNMAGRDTGHFGSGTYFSTYNCPNFEKNVNDTTDKSNPKFIMIRDGLYRVDFDLYKNLYRVTSKYHGDLLFSMLKSLNNMYNKIAYRGEFDPFKDYEMIALNGKSTQWITEINGMPEKRAIRILKNYTDSGHALDASEIKYFLNDRLRKYYLKMLFNKKPKDFWGEDICEQLFGSSGFDELIVENDAYYWVNYEGRRSTGLIKFLDDFAFNVDFGNGSDEEKRKKKESFLNKMKGFMTRDLNDMEERYIDSVYFTNQGDF